MTKKKLFVSLLTVAILGSLSAFSIYHYKSYVQPQWVFILLFLFSEICMVFGTTGLLLVVIYGFFSEKVRIWLPWISLLLVVASFVIGVSTFTAGNGLPYFWEVVGKYCVLGFPFFLVFWINSLIIRRILK